MSERFIPIGINVVIVPDDAPEEVGGFLLPEQAKKEPLTGIVVAVGPGRIDYKMTVEVGDRVGYPRFGWTETSLFRKLDDGSTEPVRVVVVKENELYFIQRNDDIKDA